MAETDFSEALDTIIATATSIRGLEFSNAEDKERITTKAKILSVNAKTVKIQVRIECYQF